MDRTNLLMIDFQHKNLMVLQEESSGTDEVISRGLHLWNQTCISYETASKSF